MCRAPKRVDPWGCGGPGVEFIGPLQVPVARDWGSRQKPARLQSFEETAMHAYLLVAESSGVLAAARRHAHGCPLAYGRGSTADGRKVRSRRGRGPLPVPVRTARRVMQFTRSRCW